MPATETSQRKTLLAGLPGYPFFPCKICQREGYSGKNDDGCDHTAFERARAIHPTLTASIMKAKEGKE